MKRLLMKRLLMITVLISLGLFACTTQNNTKIPLPLSNSLIAADTEKSELAPVEKEIFGLIQKHYLWDDIKLDSCKKYFLTLKEHPLKALTKIPKGLQVCLDEFSRWLTPYEIAMMFSDLSGHFEGIGIIITEKDGKVVIVKIMKEGVSKGLLQADDIILRVRQGGSEKSIIIKDVKDVVKHVRGPVGKEVFLTIERKNKIIEIGPIVRAKIEMNYVNHKKIDDDIIYIQIEEFGAFRTSDDFEAPLKKFKKTGNINVIIDLRDNPGGIVMVVFESLYYFSKNPKDIVLSKRFKHEKITYTIGSLTGKFHNPATKQKKPPGEYSNFRVVILINGDSASASEIFAGTMKDWGQGHGRYVVVGQTSFGKGVGQSISTLSDKSALLLTVFEFLVGNSKIPIHEEGITPNYVVKDSRKDPNDTATEKDLQFMKALEWLKTGKVTP